MIVGIVGDELPVADAARRLANSYQLQVLSEPARARDVPGAVTVTALPELARKCAVIVVCASSTASVRELLWEAGGLRDGMSPDKIVIDLTPGDPEETRALAAELQKGGVHYIDAPLYGQRREGQPELTAITCGGPAEVVQSVRSLLETLCPKVIYCGDAGNGQAARLVVAVVAACNRLITYEGAATGNRNGLSFQDIGHVLTRCSGYSSATEHVLPAIAAGGRSIDVPLSKAVADLVMASRLAVHVGAPLMMGNLARSLLQSESTALGESGHLDDTFRIFSRSAGAESAP